MPGNKRQRTLVDFKIPKTDILRGNQPKEPQSAPLYIDLECDEVDVSAVVKQETATNGRELFVTDEDDEVIENAVEVSGKPEIDRNTASKLECGSQSESCDSDLPRNDDSVYDLTNEPQKLELQENNSNTKIRRHSKEFPIKLRHRPEKKPRVSRLPSKVDTELPGSELKPVVSIPEVGQEQQVLCPVCGVVLTSLEIHEREAHCDNCLTTGPPSTAKRTGRPLPKLPNVKKIRFTNHTIVVDGFNFDSDPAINQYFLSHFHADHYMGVKKSWTQGSIYCSKVSADLLSYKFKVPYERIVALPQDVTVQVAEGVSVISFDANHCPGSFVFLFREFDKDDNTIQWVLHTGDFRSNNELISRVNAYTNNAHIDKVYLDTTYMYPSYHFPLQGSVLDATSAFTDQLNTVGFKKLFGDRQSSIMNFLSKSLRQRHLYKFVFVVGTYTIGKEKLAVAIAQKLGTKIFLPKDTTKHRIFQTYESIFPEGIITHDITKSCVHLVSMRTLATKESLQFYFKPIAHIYEDMVAFSPTGWSFKSGGKFIKLYESLEQKRIHTLELLDDTKVDHMDAASLLSQYKRQARFQVFRVPYSEHSSFKELANFCSKLPWIKMIPTVNTRDTYMVQQMEGWFKAWKSIQDERRLQL
ncbi:LAME_0F17590g1_1 [Lachancea meyersii CBS 8951]|uniref:LAME_0F17590g1_1 n=1 Tax=Lachancea meyersii CBS 8951 TaxID=1266667 RepID=A0A1G4JZZ3_9SACH|nr:LAME_0F17590g1_1 [Lachancea meyersii CBS 8951]